MASPGDWTSYLTASCLLVQERTGKREIPLKNASGITYGGLELLQHHVKESNSCWVQILLFLLSLIWKVATDFLTVVHV